METYKTPISIRALGITSLIFGILGAALYWWTPMGIVMSLTGLVTGFMGWTFASKRVPGVGLAIAGMLLCLASLILDSVVAGVGAEVIKLHSLQ
jgi:hypothetical protein